MKKKYLLSMTSRRLSGSLRFTWKKADMKSSQQLMEKRVLSSRCP